MVAPARSLSTHISVSLKNPTPKTQNPNFFLLTFLIDDIYGCTSQGPSQHTSLSLSLNPTPQTLNPNFFFLALSNDEIYGCTSTLFFNTHPSLSLSKPYTPNPNFFFLTLSNDEIYGCTSTLFFNTHLSLSL